MIVILRRHQKWMWAAIIAVVIPSFVIFFTPDATLQSGGARANFGSLNGRPISQEDYAIAYHETELRYFISYGSWPSGDEARRFGVDVDREARSRVLMIELLKENHIHASDEAIGKWISTTFQDRRQRVFRPESVTAFLQRVQEKGIREADFLRFVGHEVGIQQLVSVYGLNGRLVTPQEAEDLYRREHEQMQTQVALFSATNYVAKVTWTTNSLAQFYTNQLATYRIPERVQVQYVRFNVTNFLADADQELAKQTNLNQILDATYQRQGASYFTDTNGLPMPEAAAKERLKDQFRRELAIQAARRKAGAFAVELFKMTPMKAANLNTMAATNGLQAELTEPFSEYEPPRGLRVMDNFTKAAFALTEEEPMAGPFVGEDGVYIIALSRRLPAEIPPLASIREKVTEHYQRVEAIRMARQAGETFETTLTNALAQGKSFAAICTEAKVTPLAVPKFSQSTRSLPDLDERLDLNSLREAAANLPVEKASRFTASRDGGFVLYLQARVPADEPTLKQELPEYVKTLRQSRQFDAFSEWLSRQATLARLMAPETKATAKE